MQGIQGVILGLPQLRHVSGAVEDGVGAVEGPKEIEDEDGDKEGGEVDRIVVGVNRIVVGVNRIVVGAGEDPQLLPQPLLFLLDVSQWCSRVMSTQRLGQKDLHGT
jgi:hypothetical protein